MDNSCKEVEEFYFDAPVRNSGTIEVTLEFTGRGKPNPEPTSPSVETITNREGQVIETSQGRSLSYGPVICTQCARHEADAERLAKENRELKEQILRMNQSKFVGGIHGS